MAEAEREQLRIAAAERAESLVSRARQNDREALLEAHLLADPALCDRVLDELVAQSNSDQELYALMSFVARNNLSVNRNLAQAVVSSWRRNPDRKSTSKALHFAALSDDPDIYREAVETALQLWGEGKIKSVSPIELSALFDGEFWVLSSRSRSSGAGFVLKRRLVNARRELKSAASAVQ